MLTMLVIQFNVNTEKEKRKLAIFSLLLIDIKIFSPPSRSPLFAYNPFVLFHNLT
jgi:hypothetical protein